MALKKSDLYSSLWQSCDELRGDMDASQYEDYVLVLLFLKYISDRYAASITIPEGSSFSDFVALKGKTDIGDRISKNFIALLVADNDNLSLGDFADFNDSIRLGTMQELLTGKIRLV